MSHSSLAEAACWLLAHHGHPCSVNALFADIDLPEPLGADHVVRAIREKGLRASVLERPLADIHEFLMPVVLLLNEGQACILMARLPVEPGDDRCYKVVVPGEQPITQCLTPDELQARYSGFILAATPIAVTGQNQQSAMWSLDPGRHWLWGTLRRFMPYYRSTMIAAFLSNVLMLVTGLVTAVIFDKVIPHQAFVTLWTLAIGGGIAVLFDLLARQLRSHLIDTAGKKCDMILGSMLFRQTLGLRMENRPASAGAHSHHMAQIETVRDFFASATISAFTDLPFILLFIAMTFAIGGSIGWVLVAAVPLLTGMALLMQRSLRRSMRANMEHQADIQGLMVEALEGMEDLKATGSQGRFLSRFEAASAAGAQSAIQARRVSSMTTNVAAVSQQLVTLVILVMGVYLIDAKALSPGSMIACVMFGARAVAPLNSVVSLASRYQGARAALIALNQLMEQPQERDSGRNYLIAPRLSGNIGLRDVGFAYPGHDGEQAPAVLDNINLQIGAGEKVAILGRIGSGKSTVLRLLAGLYQPVQGAVEVDGLDLRQLDPADYRPVVGFVSQEPRLFQGSLRDNILMGRTSADGERLLEVAQLTGLDRMVAAHPQGWEMPVGEMGNLLSGGQRQLVALARSLVTRPQILLMDEPTSSMDAQSEMAFLRQLRQATTHCTLVMVTHRPAVLELVSRVVVMEAGKVMLDGPRQQVLAAVSGKPVAATQPAPDASPRVAA
ncbi:MAG: type I secretion system permease/ATPase [Burkholderiaceae bacterium]